MASLTLKTTWSDDRRGKTVSAFVVSFTVVWGCATLSRGVPACNAALFAGPARRPQATVRYLSADNVYVDAGRAEGIVAGDTLVVERGGRALGRLVVVRVAEHSAACAPVVPGLGGAIRDSGSEEGATVLARMALRAGDAVHAVRPQAPAANGRSTDAPAAIAAAEGAGGPVEPTSGESATRRRRELPQRPPWQGDAARVAGSASLQWQRYVDDEGTGLGVDQPTLRVSLHARRLWGRDYTFRVLARARRIERERAYAAAPERVWSHHVAVFSFAYHDPGARLNYQVGRVRTTSISGVGVLDGGLVESRLSGVVRAGLFEGYQPDWHTSEPRGALRKQGLFARAERGDWGSRRWAAAVAATGEYAGNTISREYIYMRSEYQAGRRWRLLQSAELDVNRGWRRDAAGVGVSLTNVYLAATWRPTASLTSSLSFDDRRNDRTRETRSLPDSLFDDAFRRGLRVAADLRFGASWRMSGDVGLRRRLGGGAAMTGFGAGLSRIGLLGDGSRLELRLRGFDGEWVDGWQPTVEMHKMLARGDRIAVSYGSHLYEPDTVGGGGSARRTNHWVRVEGTRELPRRFFVSGACEKDWGDDLKGHRLSGEFGVAF